MTCSARQKDNIDAIWGMISNYQVDALKNHAFYEKRTKQNKEWMQKLIFELLEMKLRQNEAVKAQMPILEEKVIAGKTTPYVAAKALIDLL
jgi:LAO/AO transport system kinase